MNSLSERIKKLAEREPTDAFETETNYPKLQQLALLAGKLVEAAKHGRAACSYAFEDLSDQYYKTTEEIIDTALAEAEALVDKLEGGE